MVADTLARDSQPLFRRIIVAVDDTQQSRWAVEYAARLARGTGAKIGLLHVVTLETALSPDFALVRADLDSARREQGSELLERAAALLPAPIERELMLRDGDPAIEIVAGAKAWNADLAVLGTHGRGTIAHFLLGSTAEAVVRRALCPVLTIGHDPSAAGRCCGSPACAGKAETKEANLAKAAKACCADTPAGVA